VALLTFSKKSINTVSRSHATPECQQLVQEMPGESKQARSAFIAKTPGRATLVMEKLEVNPSAGDRVMP